MTPKLCEVRELNKTRASRVHFQVDPPMLGQANMAVDESLIERMPPDAKAIVRVYRWSEPTLSLGHFQTLPEKEVSSWVTLPKVTRKTGGGAIVHHHELTYSIAIPAGSDLGRKGHSEELYRAVHTEIVRSLRSNGWDARLSESCSCKRTLEGGSSPFLCFHRRSPVDVVVDGHKIAGSAQRRTKHGLMQHGSVLLRRSSYTEDLIGLFDLPRQLVTDEFALGFVKKQEIRSSAEIDADSLARQMDDLDSRFDERWLVEILSQAVSSHFPKDSRLI